MTQPSSQRVRQQLGKARQNLQYADMMLNTSTNNAGRFAYMACFHAAQAALLHFKGDEPKTHRGLRSQFAKLSTEVEGLGKKMGSFLTEAYRSKQRADYEYEAPMAMAKAKATILGAQEFVDRVEALLAA